MMEVEATDLGSKRVGDVGGEEPLTAVPSSITCLIPTRRSLSEGNAALDNMLLALLLRACHPLLKKLRPQKPS